MAPRKDVFLCHASPDKSEVVIPLAAAFQREGVEVWLDQSEILWGDRLVTKVQDGLVKARYVVVAISEAFLEEGRNWPDRELDAALAMEIEGESVVLPLLIGDESKLLKRHPFLQAKRYIVWDGRPNDTLEAMRLLFWRDRRHFEDATATVVSLPILPGLEITGLAYGRGPARKTHQQPDLFTLPPEVQPPRKWVPFDGREAYIVKELLPHDWREHDPCPGMFVPHRYTVSGRSPDSDLTIALYRINDQVYFVGSERVERGSFEVTASQGRGGLSSLLEPGGTFQNDNPYTIGNGIGGARLLTAVAFSQDRPIGRSPYILCLRKGVLYPDDILFSQKTGTAIVPPGTTDFRSARFLFQAHQPNGTSSDLYVSDFDGSNLCNLTRKDQTAYDGLYDSQGEEIGRWLDDRRITYCRVRNGSREVAVATDCQHRPFSSLDLVFSH